MCQFSVYWLCIILYREGCSIQAAARRRSFCVQHSQDGKRQDSKTRNESISDDEGKTLAAETSHQCINQQRDTNEDFRRHFCLFWVLTVVFDSIAHKQLFFVTMWTCIYFLYDFVERLLCFYSKNTHVTIGLKTLETLCPFPLFFPFHLSPFSYPLPYLSSPPVV